MAHSKTSGADPTDGRLPDIGSGEEESSKAGTECQQAEGDGSEEQVSQIGTRRRHSGKEECRDATPSRRSRSRRRRRDKEGDHQREPSDHTRKRRRKRRNKRMVEEREAPETMEAERTPERKRSESEGARKRKGPGAEDGQNEEPDAETDWEQESLQSTQVEEGGEHLLGVLKSWLQSEECGGLSISQCGALLAVAAFRSGTPLGSYLSRALVPGSSSGQRNRRQRSLLPLPLWDDPVTELKKLQEEGEFRRLAGSWAEKKTNKDKAGRLSRKVGLLVWHGLTVTVLNFLWTGGGGKGEVAAGPPGKAQSQALDRIWELVKVFVDDNSESTRPLIRSCRGFPRWGMVPMWRSPSFEYPAA